MMNISHPCRLSLMCFSLVLLTVTGCGGSDRPPLAPASGKVTLDGAPVSGATVTYVPADGGRPSSAITNDEGHYEMNSFSDDSGAIVGDHHVSVMKVSGQGAFMLESAEESVAQGGDESTTGADSLSPSLSPVDGNAKKKVDIDSLTEYLVPKKYMDAKQSGLKITVPSEGSDTLDLTLQSSP